MQPLMPLAPETYFSKTYLCAPVAISRRESWPGLGTGQGRRALDEFVAVDDLHKVLDDVDAARVEVLEREVQRSDLHVGGVRPVVLRAARRRSRAWRGTGRQSAAHDDRVKGQILVDVSPQLWVALAAHEDSVRLAVRRVLVVSLDKRRDVEACRRDGRRCYRDAGRRQRHAGAHQQSLPSARGNAST